MVAVAGLAAAAALATTAAGPAAAQSQTGWVGGTPPTDGIVYLHSSTITDSPALAASTVIYTSFGQMAPAFRMGVQPRLFKSGVLCQILNYTYNATSVPRLERATSGNCGSGSYNSNGFVSVSDGTDSAQYVTFPTNAINYTAPATARAATAYQAPADSSAAGTNAAGERLGSAATARAAKDVPDLILSYGSNGQLGYVKNRDLTTKTSASSIPLLKADGTTVIGTFTMRAAK